MVSWLKVTAPVLAVVDRSSSLRVRGHEALARIPRDGRCGEGDRPKNHHFRAKSR
jgi:hypothetical protein